MVQHHLMPEWLQIQMAENRTAPDSLTGTLAGTCDVTGTGGWQNWVTSTCEVSGATESVICS